MADPQTTGTDLWSLMGRERPATDPGTFSDALNKKLSKPIDTANGESIFDPQVMSRYFDDPSVPETDKQTIVQSYMPSLSAQAFDDAVRQSVGGEPVRSKGLLGRSVGWVTDVVGNPIVKGLEALGYPADKTEQAIGTGLLLPRVFKGDISVGDAWQLSKVTYESYGQTGWWKFNGDKQLDDYVDQLNRGETTIDDILAEHEHGVPDLFGKMILDPLWLLGGVPGIPNKLYKTEKGIDAAYKTGVLATFARGLAEGIRLEHFGPEAVTAAEKLRRIPLVGGALHKGTELLFGAFVPTEHRIFNNALVRWHEAVQADDVEKMVTSWRDVNGLLKLTPQSKADHIFNHLITTMASADMTQDEVIQLSRAIESGRLELLPEKLANAFNSREGAILFQALKDRGVDFRRFPSMLKNVAGDEAVWDAAIREGGQVAEDAAKLSHRNVRAFQNAFYQDLHNITYGALQQWHGVPGKVTKVIRKVGGKSEEIERFVADTSVVQKFSNGLKFLMGTTMLNRPGFPVLNYLNNGMTLAMDYGIGRAARYWLDPFGKRGFFERELGAYLREDGLDPELIKIIVGDRSVAREILFGGGPEDKLLGIKRGYWAPMVSITSKFDMGARMHAFYEMYGRGRNAVWKFGAPGKRGVLPALAELDPELASRLGPELTSRLHSAILNAGPNPDALRAIVGQIAEQGRPPLTAEHFIEKLADELGLQDDARQAFNDAFEPAFRERITAILKDAGNDSGRLKTRLDRLRGAIRQQLHRARDLDNLAPAARDYRNLPSAIADHEALMAERDKTLLMQIRRYMVASGDRRVDDVLQSVAEWQNAARQQRYILNYVGQLLDIPPERLASDTMFQLVPEHLRDAVQSAHRDLVNGFDELTPDRTPGDFFEVLGDLAARWADQSETAAIDLVERLSKLQEDGAFSPALQELFNSVAGAEGSAGAARERLFSDLIENHPRVTEEADFNLLEGQTEWVGSRWTEHFRELDNLYNDALEREASLLGFEHRAMPHSIPETPTVGEMLGVRNSTLEQFMDFVERQHPTELLGGTFDGADLERVKTYLDQVAQMAPDAKRLQVLIARSGADFSMLNYDTRYGLDAWTSLVYPYAFWPTRSMWHWAQRGLARPGAVASTVKLYDLIQEINADANVPQRMRQGIRFGIPFLDKSLQGGPLYFDPIRVLFPTADWSVDNNFGQTDSSGGTFAGVPRSAFATLNQWAQKVGPGLNPFIDTAFQWMGGNDRALYLKYRFSAMPFIMAGPRQLQALYSFANTGEDPDNALDEQTKADIAMGQHLPEDKLKQILAMSDDEFDLYRTQRVLANEVGNYLTEGHTKEQRQQFVNEALQAMFSRSGPLWDQARTTSKHETGLAVVTGWLFGVPFRQFPNGEKTQLGLQTLFKQVQSDARAEGAGDKTAAFTEMFPELEVRDASVAIFDGTDKQDSEIAGNLFAQKLEKIKGTYDDRIKALDAQITAAEKHGYLKTKEGRNTVNVLKAQRDALSAQKSGEIDAADTLYDARNQAPSMSRTPRTRALQELETAYYDLAVKDGSTADVTAAQRKQDQFIKALPTASDAAPFADAVNHYVVMHRYDQQITAAYDAGDRDKAQQLVAERQQYVLDRTKDQKERVTQRDFQQYLDRNKRPPTSQELEYDQAKQQIAEYTAIKDRAGEIGYSSKDAAAIARGYWDSHPLLKTYYGSNPDLPIHTVDDIAKYDRMQAIWDQFYSLEGGAQARIDYLAMTLDELNALRRHFGMPPVKIQDPYWEQDAPPPRYEGSNPSGY